MDLGRDELARAEPACAPNPVYVRALAEHPPSGRAVLIEGDAFNNGDQWVRTWT